MAKKAVGKIKRQKNKLYYVTGNGTVMEADMNRRGGKKGRKVCGSSAKSAPKKKAAKKAASKKKVAKKAAPKRRTVKKAARKKTARKRK